MIVRLGGAAWGAPARSRSTSRKTEGRVGRVGRVREAAPPPNGAQESSLPRPVLRSGRALDWLLRRDRRSIAWEGRGLEHCFPAWGPPGGMMDLRELMELNYLRELMELMELMD